MRVAPHCTGMSRKRNEKLSHHSDQTLCQNTKFQGIFMYDQLLVKFTTHF